MAYMKKTMEILYLALALQCISATKIICYHGTWSAYRTGEGKFAISDIDPKLCTHYIYTFIGVNSTSMEVTLLDEWLDIELGNFANAVGLKNKNPDLKVLVAVGGYNEGSAKFSNVAATASSRTIFINSVINLLQTYNFDGLDIDWEYPALGDSTNSLDKNDLVLLLKALRTAFDEYGYILTAAVSASLTNIDLSYDVPALSQYLDVINLMTYDFFGSWDTNTGNNAPLYNAARYTSTEYAKYNVNTTVAGWLARGAAADKIALGVPFYGRTYTLASSSDNGENALISGAGPSGPYTATSGFLGYNEILENFAGGGWTEKWDDEAQVPYAYKDNVWLSYDNPKSINLKVEYAKEQELGGIMVWSIETDDFHGTSGTTFELLTTINEALSNSDDSSSSTKSSPTITTTLPKSTTVSSSKKPSSATSTSKTEATTAGPIATDQCSSVGFFRDVSNCSEYYYCQLVNGVLVAIKLSCSAGLYYDTKTETCNWADKVNC